MHHLTLRIATPFDAPALLDIYSHYVEHTAITFEYTVPTLEEFKARIQRILEHFPYIIAEQDGQILGYTYAGKFKERAAYAWCVETTIYVQKDAKKQGVGRVLYEALERVLGAQHILNLNACIAYPAQESAHLTKDSVWFHEKMGYVTNAVFHQCGYKEFEGSGEWYDMIWMEKMLGEHTEHPAEVIPFRSLDVKLVSKLLQDI